jgi:hypothetical protein
MPHLGSSLKYDTNWYEKPGDGEVLKKKIRSVMTKNDRAKWKRLLEGAEPKRARIKYADAIDRVKQQQQLKKLGFIIYYLDKFNQNWSIHKPRAQGQTVLQSKPLEMERGHLSFQDFHPGTYGCAAIQLLFSNITLSRCSFVLLRCVDSYPLESTRLPN